jgi:hypothetical protein
VARGERPVRPSDDQWLGPPISETAWTLVVDCWNQSPTDRPSIDEVLKRLPSMSLSPLDLVASGLGLLTPLVIDILVIGDALEGALSHLQESFTLA